MQSNDNVQDWMQFEIPIAKDKDDLYTTRDIFLLRNRCKYFYHAVRSMIDNYDNYSVVQCFQIAIDFISKYKNPTKSDPKTVLH